MHPLFKKPLHLLIALAAWLLISLSYIILQHSLIDTQWTYVLVLSAPPLVLLFFILLANYFIARSINLRETKLYWSALKHGLAAIMINAFWMQLTMLYSESLVLFSGDTYWRELFTRSLPLYASAGFLFYFIVVLLHYLYLENEYAYQLEQNALQNKLAAAKAELHALKLSVHPHFLFNSFNALNALILSDPAKASEIAIQLADFLRSSLNYAQADWTTVKQEIEHINAYLNIERIRLGERLRQNFEIDPGAEKIYVPAFTFLPVIENAVKHGIEQQVEGGVINLQLRQDHEHLFCSVSNPCPEQQAPGNTNGFGLDALRKRLRNAYSQKIEITEQKNNHIFALSFNLPLQPRPPR